MFNAVTMTISSLSKISFFPANIFTKKIDKVNQVNLKSSSNAIANDWKKVGNDMRKGIIKYDRSIAK